MSTPSIPTDGQSLPPADEQSRSLIGRFNKQTLTTPVQFLGFWSAVVLPFLHVPLFLGGLETTAETTTFLALLGLNLLAFVVGQSYNRD